jgi:hypothetical protein
MLLPPPLATHSHVLLLPLLLNATPLLSSQLYNDPAPEVAKLLPNTYHPLATAVAGSQQYLPTTPWPQQYLPPPGHSSTYHPLATAVPTTPWPQQYLPPPGHSSSGESARPDSLALFSLLLSDLKFQAGVVGKAPQQQQQPSGPVELLVYCADALALLLAMSDLSEEPGGNTSVRHRGLVLAGRLLISTGQALQVSCCTFLCILAFEQATCEDAASVRAGRAASVLCWHESLE